jgi:hypothetical protein
MQRTQHWFNYITLKQNSIKNLPASQGLDEVFSYSKREALNPHEVASNSANIRHRIINNAVYFRFLYKSISLPFRISDQKEPMNIKVARNVHKLLGDC